MLQCSVVLKETYQDRGRQQVLFSNRGNHEDINKVENKCLFYIQCKAPLIFFCNSHHEPNKPNSRECFYKHVNSSRKCILALKFQIIRMLKKSYIDLVCMNVSAWRISLLFMSSFTESLPQGKDQLRPSAAQLQRILNERRADLMEDYNRLELLRTSGDADQYLPIKQRTGAFKIKGGSLTPFDRTVQGETIDFSLCKTKGVSLNGPKTLPQHLISPSFTPPPLFFYLAQREERNTCVLQQQRSPS